MVQWIYNKIAQLKKKEISLVRDTKWFNYFYATLWQIQDKISPILEELKLLVIHRVENQKVITKIIDLEDNSFIESWIDIWEVKTETKKNLKDWWESIEINTLDPQGVGSIITYYRRYNLLALLDLETEDDDGASWSQRAQAKPQYAQKETKTETNTPVETNYWKCRDCWAENVLNPKTWKIFCSNKCFLPKKVEPQQDLSETPF
jgi:hypothetical protein